MDASFKIYEDEDQSQPAQLRQSGERSLARLSELQSRVQKRTALKSLIASFKEDGELLVPGSNIIKTALRAKRKVVSPPAPQPQQVTVIESSAQDDSKRKRKTTHQLAALREAYKKNPDWNKAAVHRVAKHTGLSVPQVYKWGWDQRRKQGEEERAIEELELPSIDEFGGYSKGHYTKQESITELLGINFSPSMLHKLIQPDKRLASSCETGEFRMKPMRAERESSCESQQAEEVSARRTRKVSAFDSKPLPDPIPPKPLKR